MVEGGEFHRVVTHLDMFIPFITRSKFTSTLIPHKFNNEETDVSSLIDGVRCVVISYDLWMSKTTQDIFSMMAYYTCDHVREHANIGMPITTSTNGEIIEVTVGNIINQFNLGSKIFGITSDGGTNLATCKAILESTLDNTVLFDL